MNLRNFILLASFAGLLDRLSTLMYIRITPLYFGADPVLTFYFDADPDPVPHQSDASLQQLAFRPSEAPL
jgi:hypothetical protein